MSKLRLFVDMDGTLAEWKTLNLPIEQFEDANEAQHYLYENYLKKEGYYYNLAPQNKVIEAVKLIAERFKDDIEIYTLSATIPNCPAKQDKNRWLDKYLPEIDEAHRIFVPDGNNKVFYVPGGVSKNDFLLDDYSKNLSHWANSGGYGIKVLNGVNATKGTWKGDTVPYDNSSHLIAYHIIQSMNEYGTVTKYLDNQKLMNYENIQEDIEIEV